MRATSIKTVFQIMVAAIFASSARIIAETEVGGSKTAVPNGDACRAWAETKCDDACLSLGGCNYLISTWMNTGYCSYSGYCHS